ncbi:transposase [Streptomyces sp. NPDC058686]|uniref:transposase n=1 Tax=Streptomyces sp. NPDC058686 TaxID=3346599 RepID=UPI0036556230
MGTETAGQLLVTAGNNPERLRTEAAFTALCGAAPVPASAGRTTGVDSAVAVTARPTGPST